MRLLPVILLSLSVCALNTPPTEAAASSAEDPPARFLKKKYETINGHRMAYVEVGSGDPIVFLHGNPTSSYLWRNVMPKLEGQGRLIAPDLMGMGDSDKLPPSDPSRYTFQQHANYLYMLLERIGAKKRITFVIHDWGSALGFHWTFLNRGNSDAVRGVAFMEAIVHPIEEPDFPFQDDRTAEFFSQLRSPAGEALILQDNLFVETALPGSILRELPSNVMDEYRRPFLRAGEDRRPTLSWPRQVPVNGSPQDVHAIVKAYGDWLTTSSDLPKLFIRAEPGIVLTGPFVDFVRTWPNLEEVSVPGLHFIQEDSPELIGDAISKWLQRIQ